MNTEKGNQMSGLTIAGMALAVTGILVVIWGMNLYPVHLLSPDFMTFATGGLLLVAVGLCMIAGLPAIVQIVGIWLAATATMLYIYSLPDTDLIIKLIGFVPVLGFALWLSLKFWR